MKIFIVLSESPLKVRMIAVYCFLNFFLVPELYRSEDWKNNRKKWYRSMGKNQSKLTKSVTSCVGHLARVELSMYYSSVHIYQDQVKLCTLKVQCNNVQLAVTKFCLSIKDFRSLLMILQ